MAGDDSGQAKHLYRRAMELDEDRRVEFLREACGNDDRLRQEVESLIVASSTPTLDGSPILPAIGATISHYRILKKLGGGGMGVVYEAEDARLKRRVALKFLSPNLTQEKEAKRRFIQEAQAASALDHPNVCTIHEIDERPDGQLFIAMARYEGQTLRSRIESGPLSLEEAVGVAVQIARGLACAHEAGIVHRDVKPANLILTSRGEVKILDFGIAKLAGGEARTRTGRIVGTIDYMSPEQLNAADVDARTDVWALGVVLYEMLAGRLPFQAESEVGTINAILNAAMKPIATVRKDIPPGLERIVHRALQQSPQARYRSAGEMLQDLEQCQTALTTSADGTVNRSWTRAVRKPVFAIPIVVVILAAGTLAGFWINRAAKIRWARDEALPQVERLIEAGRIVAAFDLAVQAERYIPEDRTLRNVWPAISTTANLTTDPEGADIYFKDYASPMADWRRLGRSPLAGVRLPRENFRWKIEKQGLNTLELATAAINGSVTFPSLIDSSRAPASMVFVPAGNQPTGIAGFAPNPVQIGPFFMDRYEVTNRQFKEFVDGGGYAKPQYWTQTFIKEGRTLSWKEAMAELVDSSGKPGPATWELGNYPKGLDDYPVGGVSWYEAAAYAEFRGRQLPSFYHWSRAAHSFGGSSLTGAVAKASNFSQGKPEPAGRLGGIGPFGAYDMAGNVREWCWNQSEKNRWILGGAWKDANYMFYEPFSLPAFDRSPQNGFRLAQYVNDDSTKRLMRPVATPRYGPQSATPVSDEVFAVFRGLYAPIRSPLNSKVESVQDSGEDGWTREVVTFDAGYNAERVTVYMFLPKQGTGPHQIVVFVPGVDAFTTRSSSANLQPDFMDFIIRSGRVLVRPVFDSSYERSKGAFALTGEDRNRAMRELYNHFRQDLSRTLDFLSTRSEVDVSKTAYLGVSFGAANPMVLLALEDRLKAAVLLSGGLPFLALPPEADAVNYLPRIRIPVLMLNGNHDYLYPVETSQKQMLNLLGSESDKKRHVVLEGGHGPSQIPRGQMIKETLAWLDKYLGAVK